MVKRAIDHTRGTALVSAFAHGLVGQEMRHPLAGGAGSLLAGKVGSFFASAEAPRDTFNRPSDGLKSRRTCISAG